jgi:hypothetical protein
MKVQDFASKEPSFVLEDFFEGKTQGWGVTLSRFETLQNQFKIEAEGRWDGVNRTLALREVYTFDDGHIDTLDWTIRKTDSGSYEGKETRISGEAAGEQSGNAFHWKYSRDVPSADGSSVTVGFDDWFWLQDADTMIAHATLTKMGVEVSTLNAFYRKLR